MFIKDKQTVTTKKSEHHMYIEPIGCKKIRTAYYSAIGRLTCSKEGMDKKEITSVLKHFQNVVNNLLQSDCRLLLNNRVCYYFGFNIKNDVCRTLYCAYYTISEDFVPR